jgi:hypothetical protein
MTKSKLAAQEYCEGTRRIGQRTPTIAYTVGQRSPLGTPWIGQRRPPHPPSRLEGRQEGAGGRPPASNGKRGEQREFPTDIWQGIQREDVLHGRVPFLKGGCALDISYRGRAPRLSRAATPIPCRQGKLGRQSGGAARACMPENAENAGTFGVKRFQDSRRLVATGPKAISERGRKVGWIRTFCSKVGSKLEVPAVEILVHFIVTVLAISSIAAIEWLLHLYGLDGRKLPGTTFTLSDLMFSLEVIAATVIILIGVGRAAMSLWKAP